MPGPDLDTGRALSEGFGAKQSVQRLCVTCSNLSEIPENHTHGKGFWVSSEVFNELERIAPEKCGFNVDVRTAHHPERFHK